MVGTCVQLEERACVSTYSSTLLYLQYMYADMRKVEVVVVLLLLPLKE